MRHDRRFWTRVVRVAERGQTTHAEVAARYDVSLATLRSWIYRLRREGDDGENEPTRLLPVRVAATPARDTIEIETDGARLRVPVGCDPEYVTRLLRAVRAC